MWNRKEKVTDDTFTYAVVTETSKGNNNDTKSRTMYK